MYQQEHGASNLKLPKSNKSSNLSIRKAFHDVYVSIVMYTIY